MRIIILVGLWWLLLLAQAQTNTDLGLHNITQDVWCLSTTATELYLQPLNLQSLPRKLEPQTCWWCSGLDHYPQFRPESRTWCVVPPPEWVCGSQGFERDFLLSLSSGEDWLWHTEPSPGFCAEGLYPVRGPALEALLHTYRLEVLEFREARSASRATQVFLRYIVPVFTGLYLGTLGWRWLKHHSL